MLAETMFLDSNLVHNWNAQPLLKWLSFEIVMGLWFLALGKCFWLLFSCYFVVLNTTIMMW